MSILQIMKGWHLLCLSYKMINHYWYLVFWQVPWYFGMWDPHCGYNLTLFPPCLMLSLLRGSFGGHVGASYCITITGSCMGYYARAGSHITYLLLPYYLLFAQIFTTFNSFPFRNCFKEIFNLLDTSCFVCIVL